MNIKLFIRSAVGINYFHTRPCESGNCITNPLRRPSKGEAVSVVLAGLLLAGSAAVQAQQASAPPASAASASWDGSRPPRPFSAEEKAALIAAFESPVPTFGPVSTAVLELVDKASEYFVRNPNPLNPCTSKYSFVGQDKKAAPPFAAVSGSRGVISIGSVELGLDSVLSDAAFYKKGVRSHTKAGREAVLSIHTHSLYRSGITKTMQILVPRKSDHACTPKRSGCKVYEGTATLIRYEIIGTQEFPQTEWVREQDLGRIQVEVVCGSSRRTGDPFFTIPWYEFLGLTLWPQAK